MEFFSETVNEVIKNAKESAFISIAKRLQEIREKLGFKVAIQEFLVSQRIKPLYIKEQQNREIFNENRKKLNTEAGLVISNHPYSLDSFLILNALEREDIKIVVGGTAYKILAPIFGEDKFILATVRKLSEGRDFLNTIKNHIESGGLILFFPTGGGDRVDIEGSLSFVDGVKDGLSSIIRNCLKPSNIIYSFLIDTEDVKSLVGEKISRYIGTASEFATGDLLNINKLKKEVNIKVDEAYSVAEDWKKLIRSKNEKSSAITREDERIILGNYFVNQFNKQD